MSSDVSVSYYIIEDDIYLSLKQMSNSSEVSEWLDFMQKYKQPLYILCMALL